MIMNNGHRKKPAKMIDYFNLDKMNQYILNKGAEVEPMMGSLTKGEQKFKELFDIEAKKATEGAHSRIPGHVIFKDNKSNNQ